MLNEEKWEQIRWRWRRGYEGGQRRKEVSFQKQRGREKGGEERMIRCMCVFVCVLCPW